MLRLSAKSESLRFPIPALIIAEAVGNNLTKNEILFTINQHNIYYQLLE